MNDLFRAARDIQVFCETRGWRFCFIGGLAVQRWGEPRQTNGVDPTIEQRLRALIAQHAAGE